MVVQQSCLALDNLQKYVYRPCRKKGNVTDSYTEAYKELADNFLYLWIDLVGKDTIKNYIHTWSELGRNNTICKSGET
jgi:hypothetical protein